MNKMKKYASILVMAFVAFSCTPDPGDNNNNDDSSPGVDEYFRMQINGTPWSVEDDEKMGGVLADFGSGPRYGFSGTSPLDSGHFFYSIPYFYTNDTSYSLNNVPTGFELTFRLDSIYNEAPSGNFHIVRSEVNNMEVFTGTFDYIGLELFNEYPTHFSNGEFVIVRIL